MARLRVDDFLAFHRDNPRVWELFRKYTLAVTGRGFRHYGAGGIWERIRWHVEVETRGEPWKINNNYRAFYARKFMSQYPEYLGFFRRRESVADALYAPDALAVQAGQPLPAQLRLWSNQAPVHNSTNAHLTPAGKRRNIRSRTGGKQQP